MQFKLISDNVDTLMGMRLAGIEGVLTHDKDGVEKSLWEFVKDPEVGIILITETLIKLTPDLVSDIKLNYQKPLIVEIPDRHGAGRAKDSITKYVREAIGLKI